MNAAVAVAILAVSTAAVLIVASDAPPLAIAFWRLALASLALGAAALAHAPSRAAIRALDRRDWLGLGGVGVVLAVHFASWIWSLDLTSVASSVILVTIHPVLVGLVSARLYREGFPASAWIGVALALAGGVLLVAGDRELGLGANPLLGDALALVGALAAAAYFLAGRGYRKRLPLLAYVVPVYAASALTLLAMALVARVPLTGYAPREWLIFVGLALVPMVLGHTLLNYALRYVTAPVVATSVLGEPVGSTILAYVILDQAPPATSVAGGIVVLAGITIVVARSAAPATPRERDGERERERDR